METPNCLLETAACWAALGLFSPQTPSSHSDFFSLFQTSLSTTDTEADLGFSLRSPAHSLTHIKRYN